MINIAIFTYYNTRMYNNPTEMTNIETVTDMGIIRNRNTKLITIMLQ